MPFALVVLLLDITLIWHAARTGRLQPWAFIILMVPLIGGLAYIVVELIPEWWGGPGAAQARKRVANRLDPEKRYRELSDKLATSDTIANRAALAQECHNVGRYEEAEGHYDHIMQLPQGDDPAYALAKAQAQFARKQPADALATLDALRERWPDFESADGHLLYARALAEIGRVDEALQEYQDVTQYFPGAEARVRYGLLLQLVGRTAEARMVFNELLIQMRRAPKYLRDAQAEWLSIAEKQLSA
ncbi:Beta-barrel assembly-enhancing protease [Bradyrhizobium ivorense]|uniref:Beta-barrel assembly-enhancing protease n=1 Tax=Bradyrhizobium ivorense TaxID=2511166 RepID=A0A508T694_9BRAD|nr:tetratricopeptide repeat protein [Bradyrhizobium ivorense]VIO69661.1 Beta-barrel assembly-enhancing protease [Bradyrhizobium ivorense]